MMKPMLKTGIVGDDLGHSKTGDKIYLIDSVF